MKITDKNIQFIDWDLRRKGVSNESLREDMLDHICIVLEEEFEGHVNFQIAYKEVIKKFDSLNAIQTKTQNEIESVSLSFKFFRITDYIFTLIYVLIGLLCLILPIAVIFYHPIGIFFLLSPLLLFGYIICFTRINYKKFELIQFK